MSKTITDIIPPSRRRHLEAAQRIEEPVENTNSYNPNNPPPPPPRPLRDTDPNDGHGRRFPYITLAIAIIAVISSVVVLYRYAQAKVTVTPNTFSAPITQSFTATFGTGQLPYELVQVEKTVSANVPSESTETANDPAQGSITILNAQATPQTLIKNTRFESPQGLIFRIQDSVTVPGGSASAPGSIKTTVNADTGGANYNIAPSTFTVPGLRGSAAFQQVTAKSDAPMAGGFSGTRASVGQQTRDREQEKIKPTLQKGLQDAIAEKIPDGYIVLPGSIFTTVTPARDSQGEQNTVSVAVRGTATAVALPKTALASAMATTIQATYKGEPVTIATTDGLTLTPQTAAAPLDQQPFVFTLAGTAQILWIVDPARIAGAVAGKNRDAAETILKNFPEVGSAVLALRPPWRTTFPTDPKEIVISTTNTAQ